MIRESHNIDRGIKSSCTPFSSVAASCKASNYFNLYFARPKHSSFLEEPFPSSIDMIMAMVFSMLLAANPASSLAVSSTELEDNDIFFLSKGYLADNHPPNKLIVTKETSLTDLVLNITPLSDLTAESESSNNAWRPLLQCLGPICRQSARLRRTS